MKTVNILPLTGGGDRYTNGIGEPLNGNSTFVEPAKPKINWGDVLKKKEENDRKKFAGNKIWKILFMKVIFHKVIFIKQYIN